MIQPRPWGKSPFVHHSLFTAKLPDGKSHYIYYSYFTPHLHWIAKTSEIRSLQLCYRIKESQLLHDFLVPPLWQTYWCPLSIFLCSAQTLRTGCSQQDIHLHNSWQDICSDYALAQGLPSLSAVQELSVVSEGLLHPLVWFQSFEKSFLISVTTAIISKGSDFWFICRFFLSSSI